MVEETAVMKSPRRASICSGSPARPETRRSIGCAGFSISPSKLLRSSRLSLRIVGFPDAVASLYLREIDAAVLESQSHRVAARGAS